MKYKLNYSILKLSILPLILLGVLLSLIINIVFLQTLEREFENNIKKTSSSLQREINNLAQTEIEKIKILGSKQEVSYLINHGAKKINSNVGRLDDEEGNIIYAGYKKIKNDYEYLFTVNVWKKIIFDNVRLENKSLEVFDIKYKKIAQSFGKKSMHNVTKENDPRLREALGDVINQARTIINFESYNSNIYLKGFVPIPEEELNNFGVIVFSYPLSREFLEKIKEKVNGNLILLNKKFEITATTFYGKPNYKFNENKYKILKGDLINIKSNNKNQTVKFITIKGSNKEDIAYMAIAKDKTVINSLRNTLLITIFVLMFILIILFSMILMLIPDSVVNILLKIVRKMETIKKENYKIIKNLKPKDKEEIYEKQKKLPEMNNEIIKVINEEERVYKISLLDSETGAYNTSQFDNLIEIEINKSLRYKENFVLLLLEFKVNESSKNFNKKYFKDAFEIIKKLIDSSNTISRYDKTKFGIIFSNSNYKKVYKIIEEIVSSLYSKLEIEINIGICDFPEGLALLNPKKMKTKDLKSKILDKVEISLFSNRNSEKKVEH